MADAKPLRELIGDAASDCPSVHISGDVYELGDFVLAALAAAGLKVVGREPTYEMLQAGTMQVPTWDHDANRRKWQQMFDAAPPATAQGEKT